LRTGNQIHRRTIKDALNSSRDHIDSDWSVNDIDKFEDDHKQLVHKNDAVVKKALEGNESMPFKHYDVVYKRF
jgi:hypothetical protein